MLVKIKNLSFNVHFFLETILLENLVLSFFHEVIDLNIIDSNQSLALFLRSNEKNNTNKFYFLPVYLTSCSNFLT